MSFVLPPELWLRIFEDLPMEYVSQVRTVSSLFSELSRSFLFEEFSFHPKTFAALRHTDWSLEYERLAFWGSDKISPHVRRCTVNLTGIDMSIVLLSETQKRASLLDPTGLALVSGCLDAVAQFTNLRELRFSLLPWAFLEMPALPLGALPHLKALHIHGARLTHPTSSIQLKIRHFSYTDIPSPILEIVTPSPYSFLSLFHPGSLRRLCLRTEDIASIQHFLEDEAAMTAFLSLHVLELVFKTASIPDLHACISPFPAIRDLTLKISSRCSDADSAPATPIAPHLRSFNGPPDVLPTILRGSALESLAISRDFAPDLLHALQTAGGVASISSVMSLTMQAKYPELSQGSVLGDILAFVPNLRNLYLTVFSTRRGRPWPGSQPDVSPEGSAALCQRLTTILTVAPLLQEVVLDWWVEGGYWNEIIPRLEDLEEALVPSLPSLTRVSYANNARS
ncbi:hypothetical protein DFH06DRAFT_1194187 [Mycena polygramma]|nr:hypothetical protein DFH06DRAFT_1194187 [Mycena polygramma]